MSAIVPFTHEDDILLIEWHQKYPSDFKAIARDAPRFQNRTESELHDRWEELTEKLDTDTTDVLDKFKRQASSYGYLQYTYSNEPKLDAPTEDEIIDIYREFPSLTQQALSGEARAQSRQTFSDINETSLNWMFDAKSAIDNVRITLTCLISDQELRKTMLQEFQQLIFRKGQRIFAEEFNSHLLQINERLNPQIGEKETQYLNYIFSKQTDFVRQKADAIKQQIMSKRLNGPIYSSAFTEIVMIMTMLIEKIVWPVTDKPYLIKLKQDCDIMYISACVTLINVMDIECENYYSHFFDVFITFPKEEEVEMRLINQHIRAFIVGKKRMRV